MYIYKIPKQLIPWLYKDYESYSQNAIKAFHKITGEGKSVLATELTREENIQLSALLYAHSASSRIPSGIVECLWADGYKNYPIRHVIIDQIIECYGNSGKWLRQLPVFERMYRYSLLLHDTFCFASYYKNNKDGGHLYDKAKQHPTKIKWRIVKCNRCWYENNYYM